MDLVKAFKQGIVTRQGEKEKKSFWASDCERNAFDLYHAWKGTPPTNPFDHKSLWRFACGKAAEDELLLVLAEQEVIIPVPDGGQHHVEFDYKGVPISGYVDATVSDGTFCEIKSFYGDYQARDLLQGRPKLSYLKQLAVYMYAEKLDRGILYMVPMPMGDHFQFILEQVAEGKFQCNDQSFDLTEEFERWKELYENNVLPGVEPPSDYVYKYDIEAMDWTKVSKGDISKARNGHKVIGDWQVPYSPYKELIIEREGTTEGYTLDELTRIKELTDGYTKW